MKTIVSQINTRIGDILYNKELIEKEINSAQEKGMDLVIFPEFAISGAPLLSLVSQPDFIEKCYAVLEDIAANAKDIDILIGMPTQSGDDFFSSVVYIKKGKIDSYFSKAMIESQLEKGFFKGIDSPDFNDESEDEESEIPMNIITVAAKRLLVVIGEDLDYIENVDKSLKIDAIISIASPIYAMGMIEEEYDVLSEAAKAFCMPVIRCSGVGGNAASYVNFGGSCLVNSLGEVVASAGEFKTSSLEINLAAIGTMKPINKVGVLRKCAKDNFDALTLALSDYFKKQSLSKIVLGLSGGIDSAVVISLAVAALGAENVTAIKMPSDFSSNGSVVDAENLANRLKVEQHTLPIADSYNAILTTLKPLFGDLPFSLAEENIQARIRAVLLMAYSNKFGSVVLNTSNKSECAVGYGTLYGDTCGALSILGDLYKDEVYDLAYYINSVMNDAIPTEILEKEPSAELHPDQKDSDSLPEYETLDAILRLLLEDNMSILECVAEGFDVEVVRKVSDLIAKTEHKRHQLPPVVKLSTKTFGMEIQMAIDAKQS